MCACWNMSTEISIEELNAHIPMTVPINSRWMVLCARPHITLTVCFSSFHFSFYFIPMINVSNDVASVIRHYPIKISIHHICVNERPRCQHSSWKKRRRKTKTKNWKILYMSRLIADCCYWPNSKNSSAEWKRQRSFGISNGHKNKRKKKNPNWIRGAMMIKTGIVINWTVINNKIRKIGFHALCIARYTL